ncbi:hypothetical protein KEM60_03101 [Austwickia sp. TVS 96-490-7B]|uniref:glycosyltransferase family 1 protein n=1 Tax=Austwickia sp. TVS 96-490-7B TaxID=2830843 RepID=UPI001C582969|nr:glycosyltransferase family 1 protein [Austwickia sp. TVS 96-490-7B]MBW3086872.1 hypothetical protein [Austwickia sp. TVS 96-490-7B]
MKVAVKYGAFDHEPVIDERGDIVGQSAGITLVRRLMSLFPDPVLIGSQTRRGNGFTMMPLEFVDAADTLVINMDVIDSLAVWQTLHSSGAEPRLMNFEWQNPSIYHHRINFAAMGLSFAMFPTFCNSARTAAEVREVVRRWTIQPLAEKARIGWVNLGVRIERVQPRVTPDVPVVLYPAITMTPRKQPQLFCEVVDRVARQTPLRVEARLHETHLVSDLAMTLSMKSYAWVGPLTSTREAYWDALARTTAFLATAAEESYGLEYVEAMLAGAIGIFPDLPWAHALVPSGYPFFYSTTDQAELLLTKAITDPEGCRAQLDNLVDEPTFADWIRATHNDDDFEKAIVERISEWFGQ